MNHRRSRSAALASGTALLAAAALLAGGPSPLAGQEAEQASVDPRLGVAFPIGGLDDVTDFSVSGGTGVTWKIHPHVSLRGDLRYSRLAGETDDAGVLAAPSLDLLTFTGGVEFDFSRPRFQDVPLTFRLNVGAGGTDMSGSHSFAGGSTVTFDQVYPTVTAGAKIGAPVSSRIEAFVSTEMFLIFADEDETAVLTQQLPGVDPFATGWALPLTAGLRVSFP